MKHGRRPGSVKAPLAALALSLALAGCAGDAGAPATTAAPVVVPHCPSGTHEGTGTRCLPDVAPLAALAVPLAWSGSIGAEAFACGPTVGCQPPGATFTGDSQRTVAATGWNLTAVDLNVT